MLFETVLVMIAAGIAVFFIGIPLVKLIKAMIPVKKDPVREAKQRLEVARQDAEAARLNKEAEELYEKMYQEALEEDSSEKEKGKSRIER